MNYLKIFFLSLFLCFCQQEITQKNSEDLSDKNTQESLYPKAAGEKKNQTLVQSKPQKEIVSPPSEVNTPFKKPSKTSQILIDVTLGGLLGLAIYHFAIYPYFFSAKDINHLDLPEAFSYFLETDYFSFFTEFSQCQSEENEDFCAEKILPDFLNAFSKALGFHIPYSQWDTAGSAPIFLVKEGNTYREPTPKDQAKVKTPFLNFISQENSKWEGMSSIREEIIDPNLTFYISIITIESKLKGLQKIRTITHEMIHHYHRTQYSKPNLFNPLKARKCNSTGTEMWAYLTELLFVFDLHDLPFNTFEDRLKLIEAHLKEHYSFPIDQKWITNNKAKLQSIFNKILEQRDKLISQDQVPCAA